MIPQPPTPLPLNYQEPKPLPGPLGEALRQFSRAEVVLKLANDNIRRNGGVPTLGHEEVLSVVHVIEGALDGYIAAFRRLRAEALRAQQASLNSPKKAFMAMDDVVDRAPIGGTISEV